MANGPYPADGSDADQRAWWENRFQYLLTCPADSIKVFFDVLIIVSYQGWC